MKQDELPRYRGEDRRYHLRHGTRSLARADAMLRYVSDGIRVLDVGCNKGVTSSRFLQRLPSARVTGIELSRATVAPSLLDDPRFTLVEANVCNHEVQSSFDAIVYGAVHHHILRERGLGEAVRVWRMLANACSGSLFFEMGHLTEGARWAWQRRTNQYFRSDEEHLHYLLRAIDDRMVDFEIIGRYWIHGARRWLVHIELRDSVVDHARSKCEFMPAFRTVYQFTRTIGSRGQRLVPADDPAGQDSPSIFFCAESAESRYFVKQALHSPSFLLKECTIAGGVPHDWAVRPLGWLRRDAAVFPWVDGHKILEQIPATRSDRANLSSQILAIWHQCKVTRSGYQKGLLLTQAAERPLADVIDLNPNNFLVVQTGHVQTVRVVDFEPISDHYRWKNRMHVASMLRGLRSRPVRASVLWAGGLLEGIGHLIVYQFRGLKRRIRDRQPSFISITFIVVRNAIDRALIRLFPSLNEL